MITYITYRVTVASSLVLPLPRTCVPYRFSYAIESGLILLLCDECFPVLASRVYT